MVIVEAIIGLGRAFDRLVVAEGAEMAAHIVRLLALGCDVMQGYALARPKSAENIPAGCASFGSIRRGATLDHNGTSKNCFIF